jgi:hypothetical protein
MLRKSLRIKAPKVTFTNILIVNFSFQGDIFILDAIMNVSRIFQWQLTLMIKLVVIPLRAGDTK